MAKLDQDNRAVKLSRPVVADHLLKGDASPHIQEGHMADRDEEEPEAGPQHLTKDERRTAWKAPNLRPGWLYMIDNDVIDRCFFMVIDMIDSTVITSGGMP